MPVSPCSRSRWASASARSPDRPRRAHEPTARAALPGRLLRVVRLAERRPQQRVVAHRDEVERPPHHRRFDESLTARARARAPAPEARRAGPDADVGRRRPLRLHPHQPLDHRHRGQPLPLQQELARERRAVQLPHREDTLGHARTLQSAAWRRPAKTGYGRHPMAETSRPKVALGEAGARLGTALRRLGYSEDALNALDEDAVGADVDDVAVLTRRLRPSSLATMIEALFLARPVSRRDAVRAIGERGVAALQATGLADLGSEVISACTSDSGGRPVDRQRHLFQGPRRPERLCGSVLPHLAHLRRPDTTTPRAIRSRCRNRQRRAGVVRCATRRSCDRHGRQRSSPRLHASERKLERAQEHRMSPRQPVRTCRGRAFRSDHVQRALRRVARATVAIPRRRPAWRRALCRSSPRRGRSFGGRRFRDAQPELACGERRYAR